MVTKPMTPTTTMIISKGLIYIKKVKCGLIILKLPIMSMLYTKWSTMKTIIESISHGYSTIPMKKRRHFMSITTLHSLTRTITMVIHWSTTICHI